MDKTKLLIAFNNHFFEFIDDILRVFPNDYELKTAKSILLKLRNAFSSESIKLKEHPNRKDKIWLVISGGKSSLTTSFINL